jgi:hypothetical protein
MQQPQLSGLRASPRLFLEDSLSAVRPRLSERFGGGILGDFAHVSKGLGVGLDLGSLGRGLGRFDVSLFGGSEQGKSGSSGRSSAMC